MFNFFKRKNLDSKRFTKKEFVVIDTELTGLNEKTDSIVSIGAISMKEKSIVIGDIFYRIVNPSCKPKNESILIHELTSSDIENCPDIKLILNEFLKFLKNRTVVGHFIDIDLRFLKKEIKRWLKIDFRPDALDTYIIFNWLIDRGLVSNKYKGAKTLIEISDAFDIKVDLIHNALNDAFITAQIFQREIALIHSVNTSWFDFIKKIGKPHVSGYMIGQYEKIYQF